MILKKQREIILLKNFYTINKDFHIEIRNFTKVEWFFRTLKVVRRNLIKLYLKIFLSKKYEPGLMTIRLDKIEGFVSFWFLVNKKQVILYAPGRVRVITNKLVPFSIKSMYWKNVHFSKRFNMALFDYKLKIYNERD